MAEYTLRLRRYDPESGDAPYWDEHTIELEPHRSVLEGILQAKARFDGSIGAAHFNPTSARSKATLSVRSQLNSGSVRPKWP